MDNEKRKYWFFGSKLNTVLLLSLIILMVIAISFIRKNQEQFNNNRNNSEEKNLTEENIQDSVSDEKPTKNIEDPKITSNEIIEKIKSVDNGPLQKCKLENKNYFFARGSVFDGSDNIYNDKGELLSKCGGGWGIRPDPYPQVCEQMYNLAQCVDIVK